MQQGLMQSPQGSRISRIPLQIGAENLSPHQTGHSRFAATGPRDDLDSECAAIILP